jgi:hypothetical protein
MKSSFFGTGADMVRLRGALAAAARQTGVRVTFRAPPPANPARIPVNTSVARYNSRFAHPVIG